MAAIFDLEVCCTSFIKLCLTMEYFYLFLYEVSDESAFSR